MSLQRVREVFHEVWELPAEERAEGLARLCGEDAQLRAEVEGLLAAEAEAGAFLASPTMLLGDAGGTREEPAALPFERLGAYRLIERLGEGGYGEVFLAEQEMPVRRRVALKMLKAGLDTRQVLARFEAERQVLAMMDHPGIARIYDAGTTPQGRPFFVMEYVEGLPVTEFCLREGVAPKERLALFCEVCRAVQHAHSRGVIHRDLKPSNVLVSVVDGRARAVVIDFGIAKAMRGLEAGATLHTGLRQLMGTPAYMSPEQAGLGGPEVDTRSDVYSLGVLLYELLTGVTPLDAAQLKAAALAELQRRISEEVPPKPSTRVAELTAARTQTGLRGDFAAPVRLLRGDLDWIVMKALEKEPGRRYGTAEALAEDVARHLEHVPVLAGPPSALYRLKKWTQRHRAAAVAAGVGMAAAGVAVGGLIYGFIVAEREVAARTKEAGARQVQAERAERLLALQRQIFESANPETAKGADYTMRQLLDDFSAGFGTGMRVEPEVEISLRQTVGRAYEALAEFGKAEGHFRRALALAEERYGARHAMTAQGHLALGGLLRAAGRYSEARPVLERALEIAPEEPAARAVLADVLRRLDDPDKALALARSVLPWREESPEGIRPLQLAAEILSERGDLPAATAAASRALELARLADGAEGPRAIAPLQSVARLRLRSGEPAEAEALAQRAVKIAEERLGAEHPVTQKARGTVADILRETERAAQAVSERSEVVGSLRKSLGDAHPETFENFLGLVSAVTQKDPGSARDFVFRTLGMSGAARDSGDMLHVSKLPAFIQNIVKDGRVADYEGLAVRGVEFVRQAFGEDHPNTLDMERAVAYIALSQKQWDKALGIYEKGSAASLRVFGRLHWRTTEARLLELQVLQSAGRPGEFQKRLPGLAEQIMARTPHDGTTAEQLRWLGGMLESARRPGEALPLFALACQILRDLGPAGDETRYAAAFSAGRCARSLGQQEESVRWLREAVECSQKVLEPKEAGYWGTASVWLQAMESSKEWAEAPAKAQEWLTRAEKEGAPEHSLRSLRNTLASVERNAQTRRANASAAYQAAEKARAAADMPAAERIQALRSLAVNLGMAGETAEMEKALTEYALAMVAEHGDTPHTLTLIAAARCTMAFITRGRESSSALQPEALQLLQRLETPPGEARDAATARAISDCVEVLRQTGLGAEVLRLTDEMEDRRTGNVWPQHTALVPRGAVWSYLTPQTADGTAWMQPGFADGGWMRGPSPLAFGNALLLNATLPALTVQQENCPLYFRCAFAVKEPAQFAKLKLRTRVLDGCRVFLNGREIHSINVAAGDAFKSAAPRQVSLFAAPVADITVLEPALLRSGENVLAVELRLHASHWRPFRALCDVSLEARP